MATPEETKRIENAVALLEKASGHGDTLFAAIETLRQFGLTDAEVRLALDMFLWSARRIH